MIACAVTAEPVPLCTWAQVASVFWAPVTQCPGQGRGLRGCLRAARPQEAAEAEKKAAEPRCFKLACVYKMVTGPLVKCF